LITDLRSGAEKRRSSREVKKSTFARFLVLFDFRLLQHNLPTGDIAFSSVAPRLPAQSSTFKTTMAISVATIMTDIVTNPNTKKIGSCEKIT
jgi:hypothetical protein